MFIRKLAFSNFAVRKSRVALTVAAVALSVSLVVAVTSGYASLFEAAYGFLVATMSSADAKVGSQNPMGVPASLITELRNDPAVAHIDPRLNAGNYIPDTAPDATPDARKRVELIGVERPGDHRVEKMKLEAGQWFDTSTGDVAVVDQGVAEMMKLKVGDPAVFKFADKTLTLKIVGITHKPGVVTPFMRTIYVPLHTLQALMNVDENPALHREGMVSTAYVDLKDSSDQKAFEKRWMAKFQAMHAPLKINLSSNIREKMEGNLKGVTLLSYLGGGVSMLAAMFIVFSALSMGVSERQRSLAMLRAVGAFKSQIGALVVFEGILLATAGVMVGIPVGWVWIKALTMLFPDIFSAGAVVSWSGVLFGGVGTLLTALAASLLPAWKATRVRPLEAMAPMSDATADRAPIKWAAVGAFLMAIDPFLFFGLERLLTLIFSVTRGHDGLDPTARAEQIALAAQHASLLPKVYGHFVLGLPALFVGIFLLAPMCVWTVERTAGPVVAWLLGLRFALLKQQLSTGIWRAAGTASALMVGLAVLIVMQVSGQSLLRGWTLPDKFPDVFVGSAGNLTEKQISDLEGTPGIIRMMPVSIANVKLGGEPWQVALGVATDSTMFIGVDPEKAFQMMELDFREGNAADAERKLKSDVATGTILHNSQTPDLPTTAPAAPVAGLSGLRTAIFGKHGDAPPWTTDQSPVLTLSVAAAAPVQRSAAQKTVCTFTITLASPSDKPISVEYCTSNGSAIEGIDYVTAHNFVIFPPHTSTQTVDVTILPGSRSTDASFRLNLNIPHWVIVTEEYHQMTHCKVDDPIKLGDHTFHIAGVIWSPGIDVMKGMYDMADQFDQRTISSVFGSLDDGKNYFSAKPYVFAGEIDTAVPREELVKRIKLAMHGMGLQVGDVREIKRKIQDGLLRLLNMLSIVAFAAMAVASLGVANTVMAGVRSRRWQFGILRSIGVTRGQLLRLVLAEAMLLGLIGCVLGLTAGCELSADAREFTFTMLGYKPAAIVPWGFIGIGIGSVMFISLAASLWPAINVARTETLKLLQAGRSST